MRPDTTYALDRAVLAQPGAPQRPSLALDLQIAPNPIAVGETALITVTIANGGEIAAERVALSLPLPAELAAVGAQPPSRTITWAIGQLRAKQAVAVTTTLRVVQMPAEGATILRPELRAQFIPQPITIAAGAIVIPATDPAAVASFTPGSAATLRSADGTVTVSMPANAASQALTLRHTRLRTKHERDAKHWSGSGDSITVFDLEAKNNNGQRVHQFAKGLTISVRYTDAQLQALAITPADLTIFWFDEAKRIWVPLATVVDQQSQTASVVVDHFSEFALGSGAAPSEAFIPSLQGFQTSLFTGGAAFTFPIEVPAGPRGIKPDLSLSYNSTATDGLSGMRKNQQSSWVGKGWSLDTGSIARQKVVYTSYGRNLPYFSLILNG